MSAVARILYKSLYWKIFQFTTSFFSSIILVRAFQSVVSAEFYALVYLLSLGISFFMLGLDIGLNFHLSKQQISPATTRWIIIGVIILALSICLPLIWRLYQRARYPDLSLVELSLYSALYIAGGLLTNLSGTLFTAYGRNFFTARIAVFINIAMIVFSVAVIFLFSHASMVKGLFLIFFVLTFLQGATLFICSYSLIWPVTDEKMGVLAGFAVLFRFSLAAFITNFLFFAGARVNLFLLPYRTSPADQGNYIQAYKFVEYIAGFVSLLYYPLIAVVAGEKTIKTESIVLFMVRLSNSFVLLTSILIAATGWFLFPFMFGQSFGQVYIFFIWMIPGLFAACSSSFFTAYYFGKGVVYYNLRSACIQLVSGLLLFFIFIKGWGLPGAALAFSLSSLFSLWYDCQVFKAFIPFRLQDILLVRKADFGDIGTFVKRLLK